MSLIDLKKKNPEPNFAGNTITMASSSKRPIRPRPSRKFHEESPKFINNNLKLLWQNWYGARVLILGFGREGIDNFNFLRKIFPKKILGVADKLKLAELSDKARKILRHDQKKVLHLGKNYLKAIKEYDVIIKSPGIPIHFPEIEKASKEGKISSQTEIFFENCPGKIVGITGTKGKSTSASLIYKILKEGGKKVHLVGNIGKPVLSLLSKTSSQDIFIYELSSHQLYNLKTSPHIAVFLNIYPEHLDYYKNFSEYLKAKQNICRYQKKNDYLIYNSSDKNVRKTARLARSKKIPIDIKKIKRVIKVKDIPLMGKFNLNNVAAAIEVGRIFKISNKKIRTAIKRFKPLLHRLEFTGNFRGITFVNDSLATLPEATIAALDTLEGKVQTIIIGGFDRGLDFKSLAERILKSNIKNIILFPTTGERIWKEILRKTEKGQIKKSLNHFFVNNMPKAVHISYQYTEKGKICLLSCASPSFGIFRDYKERGNLFKRYVKKYGK
jgi:UDP-N-acetylmuramoylalanine--D-glutamate ligase